MSSTNLKKITRQYVGEIPILQNIAHQMGIREIFSNQIISHGNEKVHSVDSLMLLIYNIACGRQPLYELEQWVNKMDPRMFKYDHFGDGKFNDDRFGRALDKLYRADRASLMTEIVIKTINAFNIKLDQLHNDSTSVKAYGKIPGKTKSGLELKQGNSKDHRPDLKQLVYCLTVSADGFVPIHFKTYSGNRTDDTTHIETWEALRKLAGRDDFIYIADCKVCTDKQLSHIVSNNGKVITIMPETWSEVKQFCDQLRKQSKQKKIILRRKNAHNNNKYDVFSCFDGNYQTNKRGYTIYWMHSNEKEQQDFKRRQYMLEKVEKSFEELIPKLNKRNLKNKKNIAQRVEQILEKYKMNNFFETEIKKKQIKYKVQSGKGRPGPNTKYKTVVEKKYSFSWVRNKKALKMEKNIDGIFPLLCTDPNIGCKDAFKAYKYQPRLEKRFSQFKSVHHAAPLLFKNIQRVEAMMFLFFIALMIQALIERKVRKNMVENEIDKLPIYPEHRVAYHPTTAKIFDRFCEISTYLLKVNDTVTERLKDSLDEIHLTILDLLQINENQYWPS
jgi:transposase